MLFSTLTVYETLYYAAFLRLSSKMHSTEKVKRVEAVIFTLGLSRCKDTIVGGGLRRGVSGGERKRVSIGHELLINPAAIFLGGSLLCLHELAQERSKEGILKQSPFLFISTVLTKPYVKVLLQKYFLYTSYHVAYGINCKSIIPNTFI